MSAGTVLGARSRRTSFTASAVIQTLRQVATVCRSGACARAARRRLRLGRLLLRRLSAMMLPKVGAGGGIGDASP